MVAEGQGSPEVGRHLGHLDGHPHRVVQVRVADVQVGVRRERPKRLHAASALSETHDIAVEELLEQVGAQLDGRIEAPVCNELVDACHDDVCMQRRETALWGFQFRAHFSLRRPCRRSPALDSLPSGNVDPSWIPIQPWGHAAGL